MSKKIKKIKTRPYFLVLTELEENLKKQLFDLKDFQYLLNYGAEIGIVWHISGGTDFNIIKCLEPKNKTNPRAKNNANENGPFLFSKRVVESMQSGNDAFLKILKEYKEVVVFEKTDNIESIINKMSEIFWGNYKDDCLDMLKIGGMFMSEDQINTIIDGLKKESLGDLKIFQ